MEQLCRKVFSGDLPEITVDNEKNPLESQGLRYDVYDGKSKTVDTDKIFPTVKVHETVDLFGRYFKTNIFEVTKEVLG